MSRGQHILPTHLLGDDGDDGGEDSGHEEEEETWNLPPLPPPGFSLRLADGTFVGHAEDVGHDDMTIHYRDDDVTEQPDDRPLVPEAPVYIGGSGVHVNGYHRYIPPVSNSNGIHGHSSGISGIQPGHNSLPRSHSGKLLTLHKKAFIHQETTVLATSWQ